MMIVDVRIARGGAGSQFVLAAAEARAIADEGNTALVYYVTDPKKMDAAYVWRSHTGYVVDTATLFRPEWHNRLRQTLSAGTNTEGAHHE